MVDARCSHCQARPAVVAWAMADRSVPESCPKTGAVEDGPEEIGRHAAVGRGREDDVPERVDAEAAHERLLLEVVDDADLANQQGHRRAEHLLEHTTRAYQGRRHSPV